MDINLISKMVRRDPIFRFLIWLLPFTRNASEGVRLSNWSRPFLSKRNYQWS